jgi:hypothetical protein
VLKRTPKKVFIRSTLGGYSSQSQKNLPAEMTNEVRPSNFDRSKNHPGKKIDKSLDRAKHYFFALNQKSLKGNKWLV